MRTHVALLRGINVGGRNKVAMSDLREAVASLGHTEVVTYVQSGNVAYATANPKATNAELAGSLEAALADRIGWRVPVVVVSAAELRQVVADNPFSHEPNPKLVHAVFLPETPGPDALAAVAAAEERARASGSRDQARVVAQTLYLWTPDGMGRSQLAVELNRGGQRRTPAAQGTARNWATVQALLQLLES